MSSGEKGRFFCGLAYTSVNASQEIDENCQLENCGPMHDSGWVSLVLVISGLYGARYRWAGASTKIILLLRKNNHCRMG